MSKLKYILRCIKHLDIKNMFNVARKLSKKTKKFTIFILIDIIYCAIKYGAGYYDYQEFEFYNLTNKERSTYITRIKNNQIIKRYNNKEEFYKFDNKEVFNELFNDYLKRDYIILKDNEKEFEKFAKKHNEFIVKPINGEGGKGVDKCVVNSKTNLNKLYKTLISNNQLLCEEFIMQHKDINKLYAKSVNTLRLFTFITDNIVVVLNSVFKIGNGGVTDNFSSGSMYTFVNDEGIIIAPAIDRNDNYYEVHPITNERIIGYKIPFYKESCDLVKSAALVVPTVRYVGWDVAITNEGPVIVEGNSYPGIFQMKPSFNKEHKGLIEKYQKYMEIK